MKKNKNAISPTREEDYANWYQQIVKEADLAEHSPVRGCMVIKPYGYSLWENIQSILNKKIKETGHKNAYFPLFVPLSFLEKEAKHVEGFAKECAIVTHHRLKKEKDKLVVDENSKLEEPLIVRPTSETVIGEAFSKWIESYRDLPLLINQWANIVRWEMRTRLFLRTTEFLWQEGHTVHQTKKEATEHVLKMLNLYKDFLNNYLSIATFSGKKTEMEKFPGAEDTYCLESMMQDGKALQICTSHDLGQNFSKAFNIKFSDEQGDIKHGWTTSWGITTRVIGALIMVHSDDDGLVLPPKISPFEIVIIPVIHSKKVEKKVVDICKKIKKELEDIKYHGKILNVEIDLRELRGGEKKWSWIKKGVPLIVEVGPKDIEKESVYMLQRYNMTKSSLKTKDFISNIKSILDSIQKNMYEKSREFQKQNTIDVEDEKIFYEIFDQVKIPLPFVRSSFCLDSKHEEKIKQDLSVTVRCLKTNAEEKKCIFCNKKTKNRAIFAKAY